MFIDDQEVALDDTDDVVVAPGLHTVVVRDAEGNAIFSGELTVAPCAQEVTPTPTATVVPNTPTPRITPPPTDTAVTGGSTTNGLPIVFLALAGILATALILTPRKRHNR